MKILANRLLTRSRMLWLAGAMTLALLTSRAGAIVFFFTDDPEFNTTPPGGELADSGWDLQGQWGAFLGTPIAPSLFITAKHVGGTVGDAFIFRGQAYVTVDAFEDGESDLKIWRICGVFPGVAQLHQGSDEAGKPLVVFGRGAGRGAEVVSGDLGGGLKGWRWGASDGRMRWGENVVESVLNGSGVPGLNGASSANASLLRAAFNADGAPVEAHLTGGDSGGAVFVMEDGVWKLAGINFAVDGPYNTVNVGAGFSASIFDEGGLYEGGEGNWSQNLDAPIDLPGGFYATRISARRAWINTVVASHGAPVAPEVLVADDPAGVWTADLELSVDPAARVIQGAPAAGRRFYRLRHCRELRITAIDRDGGSIVMRYE